MINPIKRGQSLVDKELKELQKTGLQRVALDH